MVNGHGAGQAICHPVAAVSHVAFWFSLLNEDMSLD